MDNSSLGGFLVAHYRAVVWGSVAVILLCVIAIIIAAISQIKPARSFMEVAVVPTTATVTINGKDYRNGVYEMAPGNYVADVSQDGFEGAEVAVKVEPGETTRVEVVLPHEKWGIWYFERSQADLNVLATMKNAEAQEFMQGYNQRLELKEELPIEIMYDMAEVEDGGSGYGLMQLEDGSGDPRCELAFCLIASGDILNLEALKSAVTERGYNWDDYEVIYDFRF